LTTYRQAGVHQAGADRHVERIGPLVTSTWQGKVVGGFGGFAAGVELPAGYRRPVLMMTTDGVGTKLELARRTRNWEGVGYDLVAMCVDDLVATGARPLALVDYLAVGKLNPERDTAIVASIAAACRAAGCALLGGETAEHPGVMAPDQVDLAATALGVVEFGEEITGDAVRPGDAILGLTSPNLRSNGYSLIRAVLSDDDMMVFGEELLAPSLIYAPEVLDAIAAGGVHGLAHITGGGLPGNLIRALPDACRAIVDVSLLRPPEILSVIRKVGDISEEELWSVFNMGIGFCLIADPSAVPGLRQALSPHEVTAIGEIVTGERGVEMRREPHRRRRSSNPS
jgi:phosphoribosylformylglycinamidine cyclo-ligase